MQQDIDIGKGIKNKLRGYQPTGVPNAWEEIAANRKIRPPWYKLLAVKYAILTVVLAGSVASWKITTPLNTGHEQRLGNDYSHERTNEEVWPLGRSPEHDIVGEVVTSLNTTQHENRGSQKGVLSNKMTTSQIDPTDGNYTETDEFQGKGPLEFPGSDRWSGVPIQSKKSETIKTTIARRPKNGLLPLVADSKKAIAATKYFLEVGMGPNLGYNDDFYAYHVGIGRTVKSVGNFSINAGIGYHHYKSVSRSILVTSANTTRRSETYKLRYVDVPVGFSYQTGFHRLGAHFRLHNSFTIREFSQDQLRSEDSNTLSLMTLENKHRLYLASGLSYGLTYPIHILSGLIIELNPAYYQPLRALGSQKVEPHFQMRLKLKLSK